MVCHHLTLNGGYIFLIVSFSLLIINSSVSETTYTIQEFCSRNLYVHTIEPGDPYTLNLKSGQSSTKISKWYQKSKRKCVKEFKTSDPASHFDVYISNMSIPSCPNCRCSYFEISVAGHTKRFCGESETQYFSSKSDILSIEFHHGTTLAFNVTLKFVIERNAYIITGSPKLNYGSGPFIETPYFPNTYTPNYRAEYTLQTDSNSYVTLVFIDFQISNASFIEVVGNNGTHPTIFYGNIVRPPVIVSQSNSLSIKFVSNNHPGMPGFRALCSFVRNIDHLSVPYTDCGGRKDGLYGVMQITTHEEHGLYDCIWHIMPSFTPLTISYLSVNIKLKRIGLKSFLELRHGSNSKSDIIRNITCENNECLDVKEETTVLASSDLYIRFTGYLTSNSVVSMSYSVYRKGNCSTSDVVCEDGRCLISTFRCDGVSQCPDGSDEEQCLTSEIPADEFTKSPGVKTDSLSATHELSKVIIVIVVGSFGLLTVISVAVIIFMCRYDKDSPEAIEGDPQQVMSEIMDTQSTLNSMNRFDDSQSPLHSVNRSDDNLPSYEDFVKASDNYPPLLYTKANIFLPRENCIQCANARVHHSSESGFNLKNSGADLFVANAREISCPQQGCSNSYNVEVYSNPVSKISRSIKRSNSLDSKMDNFMKHTCHLFLSITHPCNNSFHHRCKQHIQFHTLPSNYKVAPFQMKKEFKRMNPNIWPVPDSNGNFSKDRGFTWSVSPQGSGASDVFTVVKTRCCSEPCRSISVHYSVY